MKTSQPEWTLEGKIPIIWVIDDMNTALAAALRSGTRLFEKGKGLGILRQLVDRTQASLSINFTIVPEYVRAGLPALAELEISMYDPAMAPYHRELQEWLAALGERAEVTVHGWSHRMDSYNREVEINPGGWEYTRRSEWLYIADPIANYQRCFNALTDLGYRPIRHVFSSCGGRMDRDTFRQLRNSKFGVLAKFPTQPEACRADYPEVPEMPWYLEDVDGFIFAWEARIGSNKAVFEHLLNNRKPIFIVSHGYEFYNPWWFKNRRSVDAFLVFIQEHRNDLVFIRYGDYTRIMHNRVWQKARDISGRA